METEKEKTKQNSLSLFFPSKGGKNQVKQKPLELKPREE